jgi:hypothetical protein
VEQCRTKKTTHASLSSLTTKQLVERDHNQNGADERSRGCSRVFGHGNRIAWKVL